MMFFCPVCGRRRFVHQPQFWPYRFDGDMFCSENCWICDSTKRITLAVNRRNKDGKDEADFFRVTAWRGLADNCAKYLSKGRKVAVVGSVSLHKYTNQKGENGASMEVTADDIEFMPSANQQKPEIDQKSGMEQVHPDDLPY